MVKWVTFDKAKARAALGAADQDRKLDWAHVWALCEVMNRHLWNTFSPAQVPIAFDVHGQRLNGKHRLQAFLLSNLTTIVFPVIYDCPPEAYTYFDQGGKIRLPGAAHPGRQNVVRDHARAAAFTGLLRAMIRVAILPPVLDEMIDKDYATDMAWAAEKLANSRATGRATYTAAFMYVHRADAPFADRMVEGWVTGDGLTFQLRRLRDEAIVSKGAGGITRGLAVNRMFRLLTALRLARENIDGKRTKIMPGWSGLQYFSGILKDGVYERWVQASKEEYEKETGHLPIEAANVG